jgi:hypothetical protein
MFVDDLFDKKSLTEAQGGGSPWHSEPEQQQMDADRRGRLGRERNTGLDEPDDAVSGPAQTGNGVYEYTVPAGQESTAQELGLQQHRGHWFSRVPIQRANFQFGQPQFREIPSQGVAEGPESKKFKVTYELQNGDVKEKIMIGKDDKAVAKYFEFKYRHKPISVVEQGVGEGYQFKGPFPFDVDHMHGGRGINLPKAETKKYFTDKKQWQRAVDDINSSKYDDNSDYIGVTGRSTVEINGREWARWSDAQQKGYIELSSMSEQGVAEGMLDNPGEQDSPVAQAIIRRILLQRTDLLAKHGPEKVGAAVDEVADFVGDVDEIGSSDVSGWVRHVEQMLGNMEEDVAEGNMLNKIKAPAAPSSPALAAPRAPAVAETLRQIDRMLESVNSKKSAEIVKAYADQQFAKLGLHNTTECKQVMAHVVHESAVRRRAYAQRMAK